MTTGLRDAPRVVAVIFAGGVGSRMGSADDRPKQFITVDDKPILVYTLEHFQRHQAVDAIYIVSVAEYIPEVQSLVRSYALSKVRIVVPGGDTAHASIFAGLRAAVDDHVPDDSVVLIHDGVRPVINRQLIDRNIAAVVEHGNAITSIPAFETIAQAWEDSPIIEQVTDRKKMHVLQAPQSFRLGDVHEVNMSAERDGLVGRFVDQAHLMQHYGARLHLVDGMRGNVKITVPLDAIFFRFLVQSGELELIIGGATR